MEGDWLHRHLLEFVLPTIFNMLHRDKTCNVSGLRPAKGCFSPEVGLLKSALKSWRLWEHLTSMDQTLFKDPEWLSFCHDGDGQHSLLKNNRQTGFGDLDLVHTMVKNSVKNFKQHLEPGSKVILLGRDVWLWAILCEKHGVPYVYDPRISRGVAYEWGVFSRRLTSLGVQAGDVFFDTGFAGTIYKQAVHAMFGWDNQELNKCLMFSAIRKEQYQQFKNYGLARNRALFIEYLPKYYQTAFVEQGTVVQRFSDFQQFVQCALLTIAMWERESPAWIPGPHININNRPSPKRRYWS